MSMLNQVTEWRRLESLAVVDEVRAACAARSAELIQRLLKCRIAHHESLFADDG